MLTTYIIGIIVCLLVYTPYIYYMRYKHGHLIKSCPMTLGTWNKEPGLVWPAVYSAIISTMWPVVLSVGVVFYYKIVRPYRKDRYED